jgi:hypothetical protein
MLSIVTDSRHGDGSRANPSAGKATVVVEGDTIEEMSSVEARELALSWAASQGLSKPGIRLTGSGAYPVTYDGETDHDSVNAAAVSGGCRYRFDYEVMSAL